MKRLLNAAAVALCALGGISVSAYAQMTTATAPAGSLTMGGVAIPTGTVSFTPVNASGIPVGLSAGGKLFSPASITCTVSNGAITGTCSIPDLSAAIPSTPNTTLSYQIVVRNTTAGTSYTLQSVQGVQGATWALNTYAPTQVAVVSTSGLVTGATVPSSCHGASVFYTQTNPPSPYDCVGGVYLPEVSSGGGSGLNWQGVYSASTTYAAGAAVSYNGSSYLSLQGSNTNQSPATASAFWGLLAAQGFTGQTGTAGTPGTPGSNGLSITWKGPYAAGTTYLVNDAVSLNGSSYISIAASNVGHSPDTSGSFWNPLALKGDQGNPGTGGGSLAAPAAYSSGTTYAAGALVTYTDNKVYLSLLASNTGNAPNSSPSFWTPFADAAGAAGSLAADYAAFTPQTTHLFPLTEGSGSTVTDVIGGATANPASGSATWTADGTGLSFNNVQSSRFLATSITAYNTLTVAFVSQLSSNSVYQEPASYEVPSFSASFSGLSIELAQNWNAPGGAAGDIGLADHAGFHYCCNSGQNDSSSNVVVPNGTLHVLQVSAAPGGTVHEYLDGVEIPSLFQVGGSAAGVAPSTNTGGYLSFGGVTFGGACAVSVCGFKGIIYGVSTGTDTGSASGAMQNYRAWLRILNHKGVNLSQTAFVNSGLGAQNTAGKPVQIICIGDSLCWGHGLTTPATQKFTAVAATLINGGNAYGGSVGWDSRSEFTMHPMAASLAALYSPNAINVLVMHTNANDCRWNTSNGAASSGLLTYSSNQAIQAARDQIADAKFYQSQGWYVFVTTGSSGTFGTGDTSTGGKDTCNPALRSVALSAGVPLFDDATDPRIGADGASTAGFSGANSTACGGGTCFNSDTTHWTAALHAIDGAYLANRVNRFLYRAPVTVTSATYTQTGMEEPLISNPAANQTVNMLPCYGLTGETFTYQNVSTFTVSLKTAGAAQTINGQDYSSTGLTVPANSSVSLKVLGGPDATGGCTWVGR